MMQELSLNPFKARNCTASLFHSNLDINMKQRPSSSNPTFPKSPFIKNSWKPGKYTNRTPNPCRAKSPSSCKGSVHFNGNSESNSAWSSQANCPSRVNYQLTTYNPITHTISQRSPLYTANKQKGICNFIDRTRALNCRALTPVYQKALKANPKAFFRKNGEFTMYNDTCLRKIGGSPFQTPLTLLRNKW